MKILTVIRIIGAVFWVFIAGYIFVTKSVLWTLGVFMAVMLSLYNLLLILKEKKEVKAE